jgi:hypothetical protein
MRYETFHFRALNIACRLFGLLMLVAGFGGVLAWASGQHASGLALGASIFCVTVGLATIVAKSSRPDLPPTEAKRTWWTGESRSGRGSDAG